MHGPFEFSKNSLPSSHGFCNCLNLLGFCRAVKNLSESKESCVNGEYKFHFHMRIHPPTMPLHPSYRPNEYPLDIFGKRSFRKNKGMIDVRPWKADLHTDTHKRTNA